MVDRAARTVIGAGTDSSWVVFRRGFRGGADGRVQDAIETGGVIGVSEVETAFAELRPALGDAEALLEADRCLECGGPQAGAR